MRSAYDNLLEEVCVRLGFCGSIVDGQPVHVDQFLPEDGVLTNEAFADALFKAEGWEVGLIRLSSLPSPLRSDFSGRRARGP